MGKVSGLFRVLVLLCSVISGAWGCTSVALIWFPQDPSADALFRFTDMNGKAGFIDQTGKIVVPALLPTRRNSDPAFHDGLLEVGGSKGIYVDRSGSKVIDTGLYRGWDFSEGLAVAMESEGGKWGYINTKGEFAISPRFDGYPKGIVWSFSEGFAKVEMDGKVGYIDRSGEFAIGPKFLEGWPFHNGFARVVIDGPCFYFQTESGCPSFGALPKNEQLEEQLPACKYSFIDRAGQPISQEKFDGAGDFAEGLAPVLVDGKWGYINQGGRVVIRPQFDAGESFSEGLAVVQVKERFGFINKSGKFVITPQFERADSFHDGRAMVSSEKEGNWYIDPRGKTAFAGKFENASPFFKGLAHVELASQRGNSKVRYAYIDRSGRIVFFYETLRQW